MIVQRTSAISQYYFNSYWIYIIARKIHTCLIQITETNYLCRLFKYDLSDKSLFYISYFFLFLNFFFLFCQVYFGPQMYLLVEFWCYLFHFRHCQDLCGNNKNYIYIHTSKRKFIFSSEHFHEMIFIKVFTDYASTKQIWPQFSVD